MKFKVFGVAFLALLMGGVWLTYGIFTQKFSTYDELKLQTSTIGLQMPLRADVKIRGVIVGQVLKFDTDAQGALITLGIFQNQTHTIPSNVTASIVPKTLFGEKYVSLVVPTNASQTPIKAGATIHRTAVPVEVERVLNDLYPLLRTVQPADINMTLNAISTALEGRGNKLGDSLVTIDRYLKRLNPQIPQIVDDLRLTARVSNTYADVLPAIAATLRNTITTTTTLKNRHDKLDALYTNLTSFSNTTRSFLKQNGSNIIELGKLGQAQTAVLAQYAPEYPCLLGGLVNGSKLQAQAFRDFTLHIVLETLPNQPRGYNPGDAPRYGETRGPSCLHLPSPPGSQANPVRHQPNFNDGVDQPTGKGTDRVAPSYVTTGSGYAGSQVESQILKNLLSPSLGMPADQVPDLGVLLIGPMARGARVSMR